MARLPTYVIYPDPASAAPAAPSRKRGFHLVQSQDFAGWFRCTFLLWGAGIPSGATISAWFPVASEADYFKLVLDRIPVDLKAHSGTVFSRWGAGIRFIPFIYRVIWITSDDNPKLITSRQHLIWSSWKGKRGTLFCKHIHRLLSPQYLMYIHLSAAPWIKITAGIHHEKQVSLTSRSCTTIGNAYNHHGTDNKWLIWEFLVSFGQPPHHQHVKRQHSRDVRSYQYVALYTSDRFPRSIPTLYGLSGSARRPAH